MKKKVLSFLFACVSVVVFLCGCSRGKEEEAANTETEIDIGNIDDVETGIKNMSEWEGTWLSFTAYCNDEKMADVWEKIADSFDLNEEQLKETFDSLCFITDDVVKFEIKNGVITAYDTEDKEVFSDVYDLIGVFDSDSKETVIDGEKSYLFKTEDENAGNFKYLCMMPICSLEDSRDGIEMAGHFHFNYGSTIEKATNRSGIPSMVDDDITDTEKLHTLMGFFLGSQDEE